MLFNSIQYLIFLPTVVLLYWILPKGLRPAILLVASYIFYASWNPYYLILIVSLTVFNWLIGFAIDWERARAPRNCSYGLQSLSMWVLWAISSIPISSSK